MVYGLWLMVYGLWFMVYGLWFMVYGLRPHLCGLGFRVENVHRGQAHVRGLHVYHLGCVQSVPMRSGTSMLKTLKANYETRFSVYRRKQGRVVETRRFQANRVLSQAHGSAAFNFHSPATDASHLTPRSAAPRAPL
jgi:hypothetical protein